MTYGMACIPFPFNGNSELWYLSLRVFIHLLFADVRLRALQIHVWMVSPVRWRRTRSTVSAPPPLLMWKSQRSVQAYWGLSSSLWPSCVSENATSPKRSTSPAACKIPTVTSRLYLKAWWKKLRSALPWRSTPWLAQEVIWTTVLSIHWSPVNSGSSALRWDPGLRGLRVLWFAAWPPIYLLHPPPALIMTLLWKTIGIMTTKVRTWVYLLFSQLLQALHFIWNLVTSWKMREVEDKYLRVLVQVNGKSMCGSYSIISSVCCSTEHFLHEKLSLKAMA